MRHAVALLALLVVTTAPVGAAVCQHAKLNASGRRTSSSLKCSATAVKKGRRHLRGRLHQGGARGLARRRGVALAAIVLDIRPPFAPLPQLRGTYNASPGPPRRGRATSRSGTRVPAMRSA